MNKKTSNRKNKCQISIYFIIFMVIYLGLQINVMDRIYWSVTLFGRALNNVPELYHVDIWGEARAEYENFGGLSVPYRENFLKENIKVKLFFPNKGKLVRVRTNVYCSEKLLLNFNIEFNLLERKIIYQPLEIVDLSEASGNDRHYYDAKNLNTFLCEYNITEEKIAEYQEYVLYDVVLRTWVEANGGIYWLEKMKLENCTVDNTFQFSTNNTQSDSEKADNIKWSKELISEETENPYSTETDIGYYLYDMFEANRGGYTGGYWFNEKENMLTYEKTHNSEMNESAYLYWKINLTTIDEETQFAKNFNKYHKRLYKTCKREMVKVQDEAIHTCDMNSSSQLSYYSREIFTYTFFTWNHMFSVIDIENQHQVKGCQPVVANFNIVTGKKYELRDVFADKDYREKLLIKMKEKQIKEVGYTNVNWEMSLREENWDEEDAVFLLGKRGFVLIGDYSMGNLFFEWDELRDILSEEMIREVNGK